MTGATVRDALDAAVDALTAAGVEEPRLDAELLLGDVMGRERAALIADGGEEVPASAGRLFGELVRRRLRREPVAYILGRKGFRSIELKVDARVLIPRPETELLVELALELEPGEVLDVGTGSGAIALAVADELAECQVTAADTSQRALEVASANASRLGLANLPYVAERDWSSLQPEVTQWEPREALLAGPDGLDAYRSFIPECGRAFPSHGGKSSAAVAVEVGEGQAEAVGEMMREAGFGAIEVRRDLAGIERVVLGRVGGAA